MEYFVTIEDALGKIEHLHSLTESKSKNGECKRFIALNELVRKIRISLNARVVMGTGTWVIAVIIPKYLSQ